MWAFVVGQERNILGFVRGKKSFSYLNEIRIEYSCFPAANMMASMTLSTSFHSFTIVMIDDKQI